MAPTITCVRCEAKTSKGKGRRCKRNTCKYAKFCFQHNKAPLRIGPSKIRGAGQGLFAKKDFKNKELVTPYNGKMIDRAESDRTDSGYAVEINRNLFVDGRDTQSGFGRWPNDCRSRSKRMKQCKGNNAKLAVDRVRRKVNVRATKKIKKGDEVYVSYGQHYWNESAALKKKAAKNAKKRAAVKRKKVPARRKRRRRRIDD